MQTFLPNIAPAHPKGYAPEPMKMPGDLENQKSQEYFIETQRNRYTSPQQRYNSPSHQAMPQIQFSYSTPLTLDYKKLLQAGGGSVDYSVM